MTTAASALLPTTVELSDARRRLFESALVLFGERGYHGVSVRDLATDLGLKSAALYSHVESKQQLLFELVRFGVENHWARLRAALLESGSSAVEQIAAVTHAHVLAHLEFLELAQVTNRELRCLEPDNAETIHQIRRQSEVAFADVIERGIARGEFKVVEPMLALYAIGGMGIRAIEWWTPDSPFSAEQVAETYAGFAIGLLTAG